MSDLKLEEFEISVSDVHPDAGEGHEIICPNCGQTVVFATYQWWRSRCNCGSWDLEQRAVLIPKESPNEPQQYEHGWISVEVDLPKQVIKHRPVNVIGQLERGTVMELQFDDGRFYREGTRIENVTYWQPMPRPHPIEPNGI